MIRQDSIAFTTGISDDWVPMTHSQVKLLFCTNTPKRTVVLDMC